MIRNAPYSKETQNMINSECIEIEAHLFETLFPPRIMIFVHFFPIVCRESPVLTCYSKIVWRCAGLHVHVIQLRMLPCISAIAVNADGNITFYDNTVVVCI